MGSFNSGIYSFTDPRVINLDGLANQSAFSSLKNRRLCNYMKENNIKFLVDVADNFEIEDDVNNSSFRCTVKLIPIKISKDGAYNEVFYRILYK